MELDRRSRSIGDETEEHSISNFKTPGLVRIEVFCLLFLHYGIHCEDQGMLSLPGSKTSQICDSPS